jgi:hypothetical protein
MGCAAALVTPPLKAQDVQLRPHAGLYLPSSVGLHHGMVQVRQRVGVTLGARLTVVFNDRFDVVTGITYIPGYANFRGAGKLIQVGARSHLLTAMTGTRYWLLRPARKLSWEIHTGLGVAFSGQPAYEDLFEHSSVSGILGTTLHYQLGRIARVQVRVENRLYRVRFGGGIPSHSGQPLHLSFGLRFPFIESARAVAL